MEHSHKTMILGLLDGNTAQFTQELRKMARDGSQVEAARLKFLEEPQLAEAMGLPLDALRDKKKWAALMADSTDALLAQMDELETLKASGYGGEEVVFDVDGEEDGEGDSELDIDIAPLKKRFGKLSRAA